MDNLFRIVFFNKYLRKYIFRKVGQLNKNENLIGRKWASLSIRWACKTNNFNLLVYKIKVEQRKRKEFTIELLYHFLQHNTNISILKEIIHYYPHYFKSTSTYLPKLIEQCCNYKVNKYSLLQIGNSNSNKSKEMLKLEKQKLIKHSNCIKYLIGTFKINVSIRWVNQVSFENNLILVKYFEKIGLFSIDQQSDIGMVNSAILFRDFKYFKSILSTGKNIIHSSMMGNSKTMDLCLSIGRVDFIKYLLELLYPDIIPNNGKKSLLNHWGIDILRNACHVNVNTDHNNLEIIKYFKSLDVFKWTFQYLSVYAAEYRNLNVLKYSIAIKETTHLEEAFEKACVYGAYNCVVYLNENVKDLIVTTKALDSAIKQSNFQIMDYLIKNRNEGCTSLGYQWLLRFGDRERLEIISNKFNFPSKFTCK